MEKTKLIYEVLKDFGYDFDTSTTEGHPASYFLNEEDMITLLKEVWNTAVTYSAATGYNFGSGTETEQAILKLKV